MCPPSMKLFHLADYIRGALLTEASEGEEIVYADIGELRYIVSFFFFL